MKKMIFVTALLLVTQLAFSLKKAPAFTLEDIHTKQEIKLKDLKGKVVWLNFWATWCPPCKREIPIMTQIASEQSNDLVILGISMDKEGLKVVKDFAKMYQINFPIAMVNYRVWADYGSPRSIPTHFFINKNGELAQKVVGSKSHQGFMEILEPLLQEK